MRPTREISDDVRMRILAEYAKNPHRGVENLAKAAGATRHTTARVLQEARLRPNLPRDEVEINRSPHKIVEKWSRKTNKNGKCGYLKIQNGKLQKCGANSNGKVYCSECEVKTMQSGPRYGSNVRPF